MSEHKMAALYCRISKSTDSENISDSIYPADRSAKPYRQKIEIHYHFIGKL